MEDMSSWERFGMNSDIFYLKFAAPDVWRMIWLILLFLGGFCFFCSSEGVCCLRIQFQWKGWHDCWELCQISILYSLCIEVHFLVLGCGLVGSYQRKRWLLGMLVLDSLSLGLYLALLVLWLFWMCLHLWYQRYLGKVGACHRYDWSQHVLRLRCFSKLLFPGF